MSVGLRHARGGRVATPAGPQKKGKAIFKTDAIKVLEAENRFMRCAEITKVALEMGLLEGSQGRTPAATMQATLYQDVKKGNKNPAFYRPSQGLFGLVGWTYDGDEEPVSVPTRRKRAATSSAVGEESEEEDVYVPKGTTARTKKKSINAQDPDEAPAAAPTTGWRSTRTRKKRRMDSDAEEDEGEMNEKDTRPEEQMLFYVNLLLKASELNGELKANSSGDLSVEAPMAAEDVNGSVDDARTSMGASTAAPHLGSSASGEEARLDEVTKVKGEEEEPCVRGVQAEDMKPIATTSESSVIAPATPCASDEIEAGFTLLAPGQQNTTCVESFPAPDAHKASVGHTQSWTNTVALLQKTNQHPQLERKLSASVSLSVELPFAPDQENLLTAPPPLTPEHFCRSMSTGSIPNMTPAHQQKLTQSFSALVPQGVLIR